MTKKFFRCTVCADIHYGESGPHECPTCKQMDKYVEIDTQEAKALLKI